MKGIFPYRRFVLPLSLVLFLIVVGTIGYQWIAGYTLVNAFYMTIITIATVGYGEIQPLDETGRIFTSFLIIISFGTFAYCVSAITKFVIDGEFNRYFKNKKLKTELDKLNQHVIVCGYGRNGKQAVQVLRKHQRNYVVIENNTQVLESIKELQQPSMQGDATHDEVLLKAGILKADALITTLPNDADNLFIVLTARHLNPKLTIISRASDDNSDVKLKIAGADNVIMPDKIGGAHMASLVMKPDVIEFIDHITGQGGEAINLEEITFDNIPDHLRHKTLKDLEIRNKSGANIIGFKTALGEYIVNPSADTKIIPEAKIFVLGTSDQIRRMKELLT